jgi:hypothetical protein
VRTSLPDVTGAVTATTHKAAHGVLKPMINLIAMATRNAILSIASAAQRTVEQMLLRMTPLMIGFLAILFSTSGIRAFCIDVLGRLTSRPVRTPGRRVFTRPRPLGAARAKRLPGGPPGLSDRVTEAGAKSPCQSWGARIGSAVIRPGSERGPAPRETG